MKRNLLTLLLTVSLLALSFGSTFVAYAVESGNYYDEYTEPKSNITWTFDSATGELVISGTGIVPKTHYLLEDGSVEKEAIKKVTINEGITGIDSEAFWGCENLNSATIPDSVTSIGFGAFSETALYYNSANWYDNAFYVDNCLVATNRKQFTASECSIKSGTRLIADYAFKGIESLQKITIPNSVAYIGKEAFMECKGLTAVAIPDSVIKIGHMAFYDCSSLASVILPDSIKEIGYHPFYDTAVYCDSANWENGALYIGKHLVDTNDSELPTEYTVKDGTLTLAGSAFVDCQELIKVTLPDSVRSIGVCAFGDCYALTEVNIPDGVTYIGEEAFSNCGSLMKIDIPKGVTKIGYYTFGECASLAEVNYGGSENEWNSIVIEGGNESLLNAKINFRSANAGGDSDTDSTDGSSPVSPVIIGFAVAGAVVVGIAVVAVVLTLKKKK